MTAETFQSVDFGSLGIDASTSQTITFSLSGLNAPPAAAVAYGIDFSVGTIGCNTGWTSCSAVAIFKPSSSGLLQDAVVVRDDSGHVLATAYLRGKGVGPQVTFTPARVSIRKKRLSYDTFSKVVTDAAGTVYYVNYNIYLTINKLVAGSDTSVVIAGTSSWAPQPSDGTPAPQAYLGGVNSIALDAAGNLYYSNGSAVYKIFASSGLVTRLAGSLDTLATYTEGGQARNVRIQPVSIGIDASGNLLLVDNVFGIYCIRKVNPNTGVITTVAGNGVSAYTGDGGPARSASLTVIKDMVVAPEGDIYFSQQLALPQWISRVRKVSASTGLIQTVAGSGVYGAFTAGLPALSTNLDDDIYGLGLDGQGNLYIGLESFVVCKVDSASQIVSVVAGKPTGNSPFDGAMSDAVQLVFSDKISVDRRGNLYVTGFNMDLVEMVFSEGYTQFVAPMPGSTVDSHRLSIVNSGNQDLTVSSQTVTGAYQIQTGDSDSCQFPTTLPPGANCYLQIAGASPGNIGSGSITLFDNSLHQAANQSILLRFEFPDVTLSATSYAFSNYAVQGQFGGNYWLTIQNYPSKAPLLIQSITFTGPNASDFQVDPGSSCSSIDVGASCYLDISYVPQGVGPRAATLVINSNTAESPLTVQLTGGSVAAAQLTVNASAISFGNQVVGTSSSTQTVVISNTGGATLSLSPGGVYLYGGTNGSFSVSQNTCISYYQLAPSQSCSVSIQFAPRAVGPATTNLMIVYMPAGVRTYLLVPIDGTGVAASKVRFVSLEPCRIVDTRNATGPYGGPVIAAQSTRDFDLPSSACGIPSNAVAYALNVTVVPVKELSWLTVWPSGGQKPTASTLNSYDGRIKANAAIMPAGANGAISVFATDDTHVILDINGYFIPDSADSQLAFYPLPPCRVIDTREPDPSFGGPTLQDNEEREIAVLNNRCNIPAVARAYSVNFTVVPRSTLDYLTVWPSGGHRPLVSTLNSPTGTAVANAAIIPAGQGGDVSVYVTDESELIMDIDGYFAPPAQGGLSLYTLAPCRVLDSRQDAAGELQGGRAIGGGSGCGIPSAAGALIYNATVVPNSSLSYLSLWPDNQDQPVVSTLNAYDGNVASNLAIVPTATGSINAFAAGKTHLILDVSGYFAP